MTATIWIIGNHGKWREILVVLLAVGLSCSSVHVAVQCCPEDSELIGDACFKIATAASSFNNAVNSCKVLGGSLARINPPEVNQFIVDYFEANPGANSMWIGLLRSIIDTGEVYTWVADDTVLVDSQAFWAGSQPSGPNGVNCVYAVNSPGYEGSWFLSNCFIQFDHLCQFDQTSDCVDTACTPNPCDVSGPGQITCSTPGFIVAECTCNNDGFELQTAMGPCVDINECDGSPCDASTQSCANFNGGFQCFCLPGLQQNPDNPDGPCIPIDICENVVCDNAGPGNIFCNIDGLCECTSTGFQLEDANGPCMNVNECAGTNACDVDTTSCQDLVGTFTCNCLNGFQPIAGNALECFPIVAPCDPNPCLPGAFNNIICNPTTGVCSCPAGYVLSGALGPCLANVPSGIQLSGCPESDTYSTCDQHQQVFWEVPVVVSNNSESVSVESSHSPGSFFQLGETNVIYLFSDATSGDTVSCTFRITVKPQPDCGVAAHVIYIPVGLFIVAMLIFIFLCVFIRRACIKETGVNVNVNVQSIAMHETNRVATTPNEGGYARNIHVSVDPDAYDAVNHSKESDTNNHDEARDQRKTTISSPEPSYARDIHTDDYCAI